MHFLAQTGLFANDNSLSLNLANPYSALKTTVEKKMEAIRVVLWLPGTCAGACLLYRGFCPASVTLPKPPCASRPRPQI